MSVSLDAIDRAFADLNTRLAVFDRPIREHVGQWTLPEPVDVEAVVSRFAGHGGYTRGEKVVLPLHEPDGPQLTGEYVVYLPNYLVQCVVYFDFARDGLARIPLEDFGATRPARRLRFWHPNADPDKLPDYLATPDTDAPAPGAIAGDPDADVTVGSVIEDLRGFLNRERAAAREDARRQFATLAPAQYAAVAGSIPRVRNAGMDVDEYGQQFLRVRVPEEEWDDATEMSEQYGIYPGMEVLVGAPTDTQGFPVEAEVLDIEGRDLHLGIYWTRLTPSPPESAFDLEAGLSEFSIGELLNPVPYDREEAAVATLEDQPAKRGVLGGETSLGFAESVDVPVREHRLNRHQYEAAMHALRAEDVYCIHGPPGTGKTRTLVDIVRAAAAEGHRVLVCAHSNQAVDNLLVGDSTTEHADRSSLHAFAEAGEVTVARAGSNTDSELVADRYADADLYRSDVVCATTSAAHRFGEEIFDYAILDEATQATIPASVIPMTRGKRLILAGDHRQLPPYHAAENHDEEAVQPSLFEHLLATYGETSFTMLRTQYRMNEEIARFPNEAFYGGRLDHGPKNRTWTVAGFPPLSAYQVDGEERRTPGNSFYNEAEIDVVVEEVGDLLSAGVQPEDIGVITPYSGQLGKLTGAMLDRLDGDAADRIDVDTVDSFQGGERDVIVVSFVRSNPDGETGFLTFPNEGPRRLNVALTRARKRLVLVGDFDTLSESTSADDDPGAAAFRRLRSSLDERGLLAHRRAKANKL